MMGCSRATKLAIRLCFDAATNRLHNAMEPGITPRLVGEVTLTDGRIARAGVRS